MIKYYSIAGKAKDGFAEMDRLFHTNVLSKYKCPKCGHYMYHNEEQIVIDYCQRSTVLNAFINAIGIGLINTEFKNILDNFGFSERFYIGEIECKGKTLEWLKTYSFKYPPVALWGDREALYKPACPGCNTPEHSVPMYRKEFCLETALNDADIYKGTTGLIISEKVLEQMTETMKRKLYIRPITQASQNKIDEFRNGNMVKYIREEKRRVTFSEYISNGGKMEDIRNYQNYDPAREVIASREDVCRIIENEKLCGYNLSWDPHEYKPDEIVLREVFSPYHNWVVSSTDENAEFEGCNYYLTEEESYPIFIERLRAHTYIIQLKAKGDYHKTCYRRVNNN